MPTSTEATVPYIARYGTGFNQNGTWRTPQVVKPMNSEQTASSNTELQTSPKKSVKANLDTLQQVKTAKSMTPLVKGLIGLVALVAVTAAIAVPVVVLTRQSATAADSTTPTTSTTSTSDTTTTATTTTSTTSTTSTSSTSSTSTSTTSTSTTSTTSSTSSTSTTSTTSTSTTSTSTTSTSTTSTSTTSTTTSTSSTSTSTTSTSTSTTSTTSTTTSTTSTSTTSTSTSSTSTSTTSTSTSTTSTTSTSTTSTTTSTSSTSTSTTSTSTSTTSTTSTSTTSTTSTSTTSTTTSTSTTTTTTACSPTCLNGGTCVGTNVCSCTSQYNGSYCQNPICVSPCLNAGVCTSPGVCTCYYGWTGSTCSIVKTVLWTFDNTLNDVSGTYIGTAYNSVSYVPGINGYGSALSLNGSLAQCAVVNPYLNMSYISFTWEFWVYPTVTPSGDSMFIGQCTQNGAVDGCLIFMTRSDVMWFAFWGDDVVGSTSILANRWSHMAFVYDATANQKLIYLNGVFEASENAVGPLRVGSTILNFGCLSSNGALPYGDYYTGYIDQMLYNSRVKNASEILSDATLVAYYQFLSSSPLLDSGPNYINGTWGGGAVSIASGITNQAVNFPTSGSYFQMTGLVLLGTPNWPLSLSLWFRITSLNGGGTLAHLSSTIYGTGWCIGFIGLLANGSVQIQIFNGATNINIAGPAMATGVWNHVVHTFSVTNGERLYINGVLIGSAATQYAASGSPDTLTFGNPLSGAPCGSSFPNQQFYGSMDQIRLYSRELAASDVSQLYSNP